MRTRMPLFVAALCSLLVGGVSVEALAAIPVSQQLPRIRDVAPQSRFSPTIQDLPLMPGLEVEAGQDVLFIFGSSRIAQTTLVGRVDVDEVYYFYQETLPQLGWKFITLREYERDSERLLLEVRSTTSDGKTRARFEVVPLQ